MWNPDFLVSSTSGLLFFNMTEKKTRHFLPSGCVEMLCFPLVTLMVWVACAVEALNTINRTAIATASVDEEKTAKLVEEYVIAADFDNNYLVPQVQESGESCIAIYIKTNGKSGSSV